MRLYREREHQGIVALVLGILGMALWVIPIIAIFINIFCLYYGSLGLETRYRDISIAAIMLGIFGMALTLVRSGLGYFLS